jgi:hypothetical protein
MFPMRRLIAWNTLAALVLAGIYAPLVHVHAEEAGEASIVHGHLLEDEADHEDGVHVESPHESHRAARWIDMFTTTEVQVVTIEAIVVTSFIDLNPGSTSCGFVPMAVPRAHDPPGSLFRIPRAPPAA